MKLNVGTWSSRRLREAPFPFQRTYITPLHDLETFVPTLLAPFTIDSAEVVIDQWIFRPEDLIAYLNSVGIDEEQLNRVVIEAENVSEAETLLKQVLGEWIDFSFIPSPRNFSVYADHDEFTTVFAADIELLGTLHSQLMEQGIKPVEDWVWTHPRS